MNCVGVDVSKGKSMIAVMRPLGEMVTSPFEVGHTAAELYELSKHLEDLDGEPCVVMEATGNCYLPVASFYGNNSLRQAKTDKNAFQTTTLLPATKRIAKKGAVSKR